MLRNRLHMWEHKKYPKMTCRERIIPPRFKFPTPPLIGGYRFFTLSAGVWLVTLLQPRWNLFIHRRACWRWNFWSHRRQVHQACRALDMDRKHRVHPKLSLNQLLSLLTVSTRSPFLWASPPAAQWDSAVRRPLWTWAASVLLYKRWAWSLVTQM